MRPNPLERSFEKRPAKRGHARPESRISGGGRESESAGRDSGGLEGAGREGDGQLNGGRESYDERLNGILEAATVVFAREGYAQASMRAVAKAANVSLAGMYHYFSGKEKILFLIQFRAFNSLLNNLRERLHGVDDPVEQLRVMVRAHVGYFGSNMAALKVCSHELDSLSGEAYEEPRRIRFEYYKITRSIIDRLIDKYAPDSSLDRHVATMSLFGTLNWLYRWYSPGEDRSPSGLANQLVSIFLGGTIGIANLEGGDLVCSEEQDQGADQGTETEFAKEKSLGQKGESSQRDATTNDIIDALINASRTNESAPPASGIDQSEEK